MSAGTMSTSPQESLASSVGIISFLFFVGGGGGGGGGGVFGVDMNLENSLGSLNCGMLRNRHIIYHAMKFGVVSHGML